MILALIPVCLEPLHHFHDSGCERQRRAYIMAGVQRVGQILDVQVDPEARLEIAVHHHRGFGIHDRAAGQTCPDRGIDGLGLDPGLDAQRQRLADRGNVGSHDDLIRELGGVPGTDVSAKGD